MVKGIIKKHPGGRPSKINSINLEQVKKLVVRGLTDKEISDFFEINEATLNGWKKKYPKFFKSLKDWKIEADIRIERSLYERAKGYEHEEDKIFCEMGKVTVVPTIKHYPPDTAAAIFWLKNRQPIKWKDKTEVDLSLPDNLIDKFKDISGQELITKANAILTPKTAAKT